MIAAHGLIPSLFLLALSACMLWVIVSDAVRYIIPNKLNGLIIILFALAVPLLHLAPLPALGTAAAVLTVGMGLFTLGLMGGGDVKLLAALSLWTGWGTATPQFIFLTAVCGGLLVLALLPLRLALPPLWSKLRLRKPLPRLLTRQQPLPYGIAVAAAFLWLLWTGGTALPAF